MNQPDLNRLRIERAQDGVTAQSRRRWGRVAFVAIVMVLAGLWAAKQ